MVDGHSANRNGQPIPPGVRIPVYDNDTLVTGRDTSLKLSLNRPGPEQFIQFADNSSAQVQDQPGPLQSAACVVLNAIRGLFFIEGDRVCPEGGPGVALRIGSKVDLRVARSPATVAEITVLDGHVTLTRPEFLQLVPERTYTIVRDNSVTRPTQLRVEARALSKQEIQHRISWMGTYFDVWCCAGGAVRRGLTRSQCEGERGTVYAEETAAPAECAPPASWCCAGGKVFQASARSCTFAKGTAFTDEGSAQVRCRQEVVPVQSCTPSGGTCLPPSARCCAGLYCVGTPGQRMTCGPGSPQ